MSKKTFIRNLTRFISDRTSHESFRPKLDDAHEITKWGLSHPHHHKGHKPPPPPHTININPLTQLRNR